MAIRWKVVNRDRGSFFIEQNSKYYIKYEKGSIVIDEKGAGIFVFKTKKQAIRFLKDAYNNSITIDKEVIRERILKVRTIGRGIYLRTRPSSFCNEALEKFPSFLKKYRLILTGREVHKGTDFYLEGSSLYPMEADDGTMLYKSVEVIT
jgi:hypothetical protein